MECRKQRALARFDLTGQSKTISRRWSELLRHLRQTSVRYGSAFTPCDTSAFIHEINAIHGSMSGANAPLAPHPFSSHKARPFDQLRAVKLTKPTDHRASWKLTLLFIHEINAIHGSMSGANAPLAPLPFPRTKLAPSTSSGRVSSQSLQTTGRAGSSPYSSSMKSMPSMVQCPEQTPPWLRSHFLAQSSPLRPAQGG
jgi:hypothetical protein